MRRWKPRMATWLANHMSGQGPRCQVSEFPNHGPFHHTIQLPTTATLRGGRVKADHLVAVKALENPWTTQSKARDCPRPSPSPSSCPAPAARAANLIMWPSRGPSAPPAKRLFPAAILPRACPRSQRSRAPRKPAARFYGPHTRFEKALRPLGLSWTSPHTSHPGTPGKAVGAPRTAIGCGVHVTPSPPHPLLPPTHKNTQTLKASRQVHATGRVGTDGARGSQGACAYLPGPTGADPRAAPLPGPGILALLDHPVSHWLPGWVTCSSQARP